LSHFSADNFPAQRFGIATVRRLNHRNVLLARELWGTDDRNQIISGHPRCHESPRQSSVAILEGMNTDVVQHHPNSFQKRMHYSVVFNLRAPLALSFHI
jgi:hypothetical protein